MAADDGFDDDGPEFRPPLPPEDRVWRHPAEMAMAAGSLHPANRSRGHSPWTIGLVSVVGGALLAGSLMFGIGGLGDEPNRITLQPIATIAPRADAVRPATGRVSLNSVKAPPALVAVDVDTPTEVRTGNGLAAGGDDVVITTASLIDGATDLRVTDGTGSVHSAEILGIDALNDLALLRVDGLDITPAALSNGTRSAGAATTATGDEVRAFGASRGVAHPSWTAVVDAVNSRLTEGSTDLHGAVQLGETLDPSAAGAAVLDSKGQILGIITTLDTDGPTRIIPVSTVTASAEQIIATGSVKHGWLGIEGVTAAESGVPVRGVTEGGPAQLAGIVTGDRVVRLDDRAIATMSDLVMIVREQVPGVVVRLGVVRNDEHFDIDVALALTPDPAAPPW